MPPHECCRAAHAVQSRHMATEKQGWHICRHFCRHCALAPSAKANMYTGNGCQRRANCLSLEGLGRRDCIRSHQDWLTFTGDILAYRWQVAAESLAGECRAESKTLQQLRQPGSLPTADMAQSLVQDMTERAQQHGASAVSQELLQMVAERCIEAGEQRFVEQVLRVAEDQDFKCCVLQKRRRRGGCEWRPFCPMSAHRSKTYLHAPVWHCEHMLPARSPF